MSEEAKPGPLTANCPENPDNSKQDQPEHYSVKVSVADPEMAMLPGGVFVMSLPLNSKGMNRILAMGWALTAVFRLHDVFNEFERIKREHAAKIKRGDLSMLAKLKDGFSSAFK